VIFINQRQKWTRNREQATQTIDTRGCQVPVGTCADLDFVYDGIRFENGVFVFGELKHIRNPKLTTGQRIILEHLVSNLKCRAIAIHARHDIDAPEDIPLEKAHVCAVFANFPVTEGAPIKQWLTYPDESRVTVGDVFKHFFGKGGN
jgi:hypothetical protein